MASPASNRASSNHAHHADIHSACRRLFSPVRWHTCRSDAPFQRLNGKAAFAQLEKRWVSFSSISKARSACAVNHRVRHHAASARPGSASHHWRMLLRTLHDHCQLIAAGLHLSSKSNGCPEISRIRPITSPPFKLVIIIKIIVINIITTVAGGSACMLSSSITKPFI